MKFSEQIALIVYIESRGKNPLYYRMLEKPVVSKFQFCYKIIFATETKEMRGTRSSHRSQGRNRGVYKDSMQIEPYVPKYVSIGETLAASKAKLKKESSPTKTVVCDLTS